MTYKSDFLNILTERGFIHQCSDFDALDAKLMEGTQSAYIGFDATAQSLHVGNLTGIMMLRWFQECGHKPITLMGGGTSKIGDPSFKDEQRKLLDDETIESNMKNIQDTCFKQFLKYGDGESDAIMVNNNDWLSELKYLDFLRDYGRFFSVNRMISFDSVKTRLERESFLSLLEFNYMVMQGFDFVELSKRYGTILQMGGSDQWGNIINGVDLGHKAHQMKLFALTAPLLTTPDGKKMGKTESGAVWLNAEMLSPYDYYQFWRNVDDVMVGTLLKRFTMLPMDEITKLEALEGAEINEAKKILAFEATKMCHGENAAKDAEATAQKVFEQGTVGDDLPFIEVAKADLEAGLAFIDLFVQSGLSESKGEVKRLIKGGGAKVNDDSVSDIDLTLTANDLTDEGYIKLSSGKKRHALVKVK
jgi:tyrosyl-tRNA synthetase